jgi:hypothetical protein
MWKDQSRHKRVWQNFSRTVDADFGVCEGVVDESCHSMVSARKPCDGEEFVNKNTLAISRVVAAMRFSHPLPIIDVTSKPEKLVALVMPLA